MRTTSPGSFPSKSGSEKGGNFSPPPFFSCLLCLCRLALVAYRNPFSSGNSPEHRYRVFNVANLTYSTFNVIHKSNLGDSFSLVIISTLFISVSTLRSRSRAYLKLVLSLSLKYLRCAARICTTSSKKCLASISVCSYRVKVEHMNFTCIDASDEEIHS